MTVNRDEIFYELFDIKDEDRSLFPKNIGNNFIINEQGSLLKVINSDKEMFERYKKAFNREDDTEVRGLCSYLCAYVACHNLLANKDTFSEKLLDFFTYSGNGAGPQKSQKPLINDLIDKVKTCSEYIDNETLQNVKILFQKLDEIQKKIENFERIANSKKYPEKSKQISEFSSRHKKIHEGIRSTSKAKYQSSQTTSTLENFVQFMDENLELFAKNENGYSFLCFKPRNILFKGEAGHALLIKKNEDDSFAFYDPNFGAVFGLTKEQLCKVVTQVFSAYKTKSKFYKYELNEYESKMEAYSAHGRLASTLALWSIAIICLASFSTGIAIIVSGGAIIPAVLLMLLPIVLCVSLCIHTYSTRHLMDITNKKSEDLECKLKSLSKVYTTLHDLSTKLVKERPSYDSVELNGIPNVSEISQLSQDVENVMQELVDMRETSGKESLNIEQVFDNMLGVRQPSFA